MSFQEVSDEEFNRVLMNIISLSSKDNTYKFAFARFLLEYSLDHNKTHVEFDAVAEYFLKYYWRQECKSKLKQAPQIEKQPEIIKIIQKEFEKPYYPQTFEEIKKMCRKVVFSKALEELEMGCEVVKRNI